MDAPVVVVGGGVMGFCSAVRLLEHGHTDVTLVAARLDGITSKSSPVLNCNQSRLWARTLHHSPLCTRVYLLYRLDLLAVC